MSAVTDTSQQQQQQQQPPWHAAFPAPSGAPVASMPREDLLALLTSGTAQPGREFLLVDVRRDDHKGGTIRGSVNMPAQTLHPALPALRRLCAAAGVGAVIWYCGSSSGRGPRAAGWFQDECRAAGDEAMRSVTLEGGIKGWAAAGRAYVALMDGYDATAWVAGGAT